MFALDFDSRLLMGRDIFSDAEGIVVMRDQSWLTEKAYFNASLDLFMRRNNSSVNEDYKINIDNIVTNRYNSSMQIVDSNYYEKLF